MKSRCQTLWRILSSLSESIAVATVRKTYSLLFRMKNIKWSTDILSNKEIIQH